MSGKSVERPSMALMNQGTTRIPVAVLGTESDGSDPTGMSNSTAWSVLNDSLLIGGNDTEEFDVFANASGPVGGPVPYPDRLETYLVPFLFAVIFIVGVIGGWLPVLHIPLINADFPIAVS